MYDPERPYRVNSKPQKSLQKKKGELLLTQLMICLSLILAALLIRLLIPETYDQLRDKYSEIMSDDSIYEAAKDVFAPAEKKADITEDGEPEPDEPEVEEISDSGLISLGASSEQTAIPLSAPIPDDLLTAMNYDTPAPDGMSYSPYILNCRITRPVNGKTSSGFGYRSDPFSGKTEFHKGMDIVADSGEAIVAAFGGMVISVGSNSSAGKYILLQHDDTLVTAYYHCSKIIVSEGALIRAGEKIAEVGSTGKSTGAHLHFEIRINGICYDPAYVL